MLFIMQIIKSCLITLIVLLVSISFSLMFLTSSVSANHVWGNYHWGRTSNPFVLKLGDNLSSNWGSYLVTTFNDWSLSSVLDTTIVSGGTTARRCRPVAGRVEVCNYTYGKNGWLGLAQIWASGDHITQGVTKLNDSYFNTSFYNTPAWKNLVTCQEVGHTLGLNHQDENFSNPNLGSCMDYTNDPTANQHPNQHDYDQLSLIYQHFDGFTTLQSSTQKLPLGQSIAAGGVLNDDFENRSQWGKEIKNNGHVAQFERDLGKGHKLFTFIIFAQD